MLKSKKGHMFWTSYKRVNTGHKIWKPTKWSEKAAWKSLKNVTTNFLGNHKAENYRDMVAELVKSYKAMGCNLSLQVHLLDSHSDFFQDLSAVSEEQGQQFQQAISTMEKWYQGKWSPSILADYWWTLRRGVPQAKCSSTLSTVTFW